MKTYKLIKKYPGSFELGHLAILDESVKYYNLGTTTRSLDYIENHPENWQHVCYKCHENVNTCKTFGCKKDYEILSFITKKGVVYVKNEKGYFSKSVQYATWTEKEILSHTAFNIYSVKRLSDGEVFTVGDKVDDKSFVKDARHNTNIAPWNNIITKIGIVKKTYKEVAGYHTPSNCDNELMFSADNTYGHYNLLLRDAIKLKQPLFTTEDGVEIFEGDTVWHTNLNPNLKIYSSIVTYKTPFKPVAGLFSTKNAAENYIKMNKPCLSLQEIKDVFEKDVLLTTPKLKTIRILEKIVKQKLK